MTEIFVISGFLGAGKTTLIQKLLKEVFHNEKVVLIENDFGDISVDAALLKSTGIEVKEINSGCICCSLSGDFIKSLKELLKRFEPDKIIIEPSGVGKLSDIVEACSNPEIIPLAKIKTKITVADVKRCKMYFDNFGEFYENQIGNADTILLSRTDQFPEKVNSAKEIIKSINPNATIFANPWNQITGAEILHPKSNDKIHARKHIHTHECQCSGHNHTHDHDSHCHEHETDHDHDCSCNHNHDADDIFDTVTIQTDRIFTIRDLKSRVSKMERKSKGSVLRAKGILRESNGYLNLQYLPEHIEISKCSTEGNTLCIIGQNLDEQELYNIFRED